MIECVIFDWAGTAVDFGSYSPVAAFQKAFEAYGITPTTDEIRGPMGMQKRAHIETMLKSERLSELWFEKYGRLHTSEDIDNIYAKFEPALFDVLKEYSVPIDNVIETVDKLHEMGIRIGSTTGYTSAMMDVVVPTAKAHGYSPDLLVCPDDTNGIGRPYPYMLWVNAEKLGVKSIKNIIKVGDTAADIYEGKNAGCISVGIIKGSNMLGVSLDEWNSLTDNEKETLSENARERYLACGADYVINDITELPLLIKKLNLEDTNNV